MSKLDSAAAALKTAARTMSGRYVVGLSRRLWLLPLQVQLSCEQFKDYIESLGAEMRLTSAQKREAEHMFGACGESSYDDRRIFPVKRGSAAKTKVNVFLKDAARDFRGRWGAKQCEEVLMLIYLRRRVSVEGHPVYNDEATAWLIWVHCCLLRGASWRQCVGLSYKELKEVSNVVKGLGVVCNPCAGLYVELGALAGRAVGSVDVEEEMQKRCAAYTRPGMLVDFPAGQLRAVVRAIVNEERGEFSVPRYADVFLRRFSTTKAGSHHRSEWTASADLPRRQLTRRNYVESMESDYVWRIPPGGYVSFSEKLEPGKTRAIYSLDSDNYLRFDAPARALEAAWRGHRANLKPSSGTMSEDLERRGGELRRWKMMFDYADFNSAHTIKAQQIVVEEAFKGMDEEWLRWLSESFTQTWLKDPRSSVPTRSDGTLMSGHRMTSIINTVLNAAYIRLVLGEADYAQLHIEHVGDDIVSSTDSSELAERVVQKLLASGLTLQREKQGFGELCAEFLRISYDKQNACGYVARSISTLVCGNWVTEAVLDPEKYANSLQQGMWTLRNRAMDPEAAVLLVTTLARRLALSGEDAYEVSLGTLSINGAPIWGEYGRPRALRSLIMLSGSGKTKSTVPKRVDGVRLPTYATRDLAAHSKEFRDLIHVGVPRSIILQAMHAASYSNFREDWDPGPPQYEELSIKTCHLRYRLRNAKIPKKLREGLGVIANLLAGKVTNGQWSAYSDLTGLDVSPLLRDDRTRLISGGFGIPFQDLMSLKNLFPNGTTYTGTMCLLV